MASVSTLARSSSSKTNLGKIVFRLRTTGVNVYYTSNIQVDITQWDKKRGTLNTRVRLINETDRVTLLNQIEEIKMTILNVFNNKKGNDVVNTKWLKKMVEKELYKPKVKIKEPKQKTFFEWYDDFISKSRISDVRFRNLLVIKRYLQRFEKYQQIKDADYVLDIKKVSIEDIYMIEDFIKNEYIYCVKYPNIYKDISEKRRPKIRGGNTIIDILNKIRTFFKWVQKRDESVRDPFLNYNIGAEIYGTPIYLTLEERNKLYRHDFTGKPELELVKDIFVFHCVIGCRISDLYKMTRESIIDRFIEYIPGKTKDGNPKTVRVPVNEIGMEIYNKYSDCGCKSILPFPSQHEYNTNIKVALELAGINRIITRSNPTTREIEKLPISQIVSSHMARRTFMGNTYKRVKDKTMVASLTGHAPNSRAFNRYIEVDDEMKRDMVKLIE
jgi:integrase